jgi:hypothetical protein
LACKGLPPARLVSNCAEASDRFAELLVAEFQKHPDKFPEDKVLNVRRRLTEEVAKTCTADDWAPSTFVCFSKAREAKDLASCEIPAASAKEMARAAQRIVRDELGHR